MLAWRARGGSCMHACMCAHACMQGLSLVASSYALLNSYQPAFFAALCARAQRVLDRYTARADPGAGAPAGGRGRVQQPATAAATACSMTHEPWAASAHVPGALSPIFLRTCTSLLWSMAVVHHLDMRLLGTLYR